MFRFCWLGLLACLSLPTWAAPLGSRTLDAVPLYVLPAAALERVRAALPPPSVRGPVRLAINVPLPLGLADGAWSDDAGTAIWRLRVYSAGATLLVAHFDQFLLPEGAELRVMDAAGTTVQGPYTASSRNEEGGLWTAMVPGEDAAIELRVPAALRDAVKLTLATLGHGEFELRSGGVAPKSGGCNVDVVCPQGDAWRSPIRSVVRLQIPDTASTVSLCTGQLVNNTAQDDTPYVLSAHHCGINVTNAGNVVAYFNFQTSSCSATPDGTLTQNLSGANWLFGTAGSDHSLIRLSSTPPRSFNAYLGGFDASTGATPSAGVTLHHASGDEKRISTFSSPAAREDNVCLGSFGPTGLCLGAQIDTFRVRWSSGVTEPGSSGAGLWNQNQRLVGVLSGGNSSCAEPNGDDYFSRLDEAWVDGLGQFLDPAGTGARGVGGKNVGGLVSDATVNPANSSATSGNGGGSGGGGGAFGGGLLLLIAGLGRHLQRRFQRTRA